MHISSLHQVCIYTEYNPSIKQNRRRIEVCRDCYRLGQLSLLIIRDGLNEVLDIRPTLYLVAVKIP